MYSKITLAKKYLKYLIAAKKLHGVHSPFVYNFSQQILYKKVHEPIFNVIELQRQNYKQNNEQIIIEDLGAGSRTIKTLHRRINSIAKSSLKPKKWANLLFKICKHYQPKNAIELGTSLGITSSYIAHAIQPNGILYTIEGSSHIAALAQKTFNSFGMGNIKSFNGHFDNVLPEIYATLKNEKSTVDFVFIDGNHKYEPTVNYFLQSLALSNSNSIFILDDIHWSQEMEQAWEFVKQHPQVTITIDLFFIGIVFFRQQNMAKEHFILKY
jgi:predicted O-methyltransferase YrrM